MSAIPNLRCERPAAGLMQIFFGVTPLATVLFHTYHSKGIHFFTPGEFSQQLGYMKHPKGYNIPPHDHNPITRTVEWTQETIIVRAGSTRLDLYAPQTRNYLISLMLHTGDIALLAHGGHGFYMEEDCEMIEVKQGPYAGDSDKTRFPRVAPEHIMLLESV